MQPDLNFEWIRKPVGILKIVALFVNAIVLGLAFHYRLEALAMLTSQTKIDEGRARIYVFIITIGSYFMITAFQLVGYILDGGAGKTRFQEVIISVSAVILVLTASGILIHGIGLLEEVLPKDDYNGAVACAAFGFILAIVHAVNTFFAFRYRVDFTGMRLTEA